MLRPFLPGRGPSPDAAKPQQARSRFRSELEAEYTTSYLSNSRWLIRVTCLLAATLATLRGVDLVLRDAPVAILIVHSVFVIAGSVTLAWLAFTPAFPRIYLPWAKAVVPVRNSLVAAHVAYSAAGGGLHELIVLPLMLVGPFFFLGLPFRAALATACLMVTSFLAASIYFGLPSFPLWRVAAFLILAATACAVCARHLEQASRRRFLESRLMTELAQYDALTGTKNRRMFDEHLSRAWSQAITDRCRIAVLIIDVDYFKAYNDLYGHQAGDIALRQIAEAMKPFVREPLDILARYGGEEFAVILYDVDADRAVHVAEGMRRAVEALGIDHGGSRASSVVTICSGVAAVEPSADRRSRGGLQLADEALYVAKRNGRNRVELMSETEYRTMVTGVFAIGGQLRQSPAKP